VLLLAVPLEAFPQAVAWSYIASLPALRPHQLLLSLTVHYL
jgi:hypothetical protein